MRATDNLDLEIGEQEIPVSIYSAIDEETTFTQLSNCCGAKVNYKKVCSSCAKSLSEDDISKAIEIGKNEYKKVDAEKVKVDKTNLKVLGTTDDELEENGYVKNGKVWFLGVQMDKKNVGRNERNMTKFAYLRDALRESGKSLVCIVAVRGKENIMIVKPYFNGLVGVGVYFFERVRDIREVPSYSMEVITDKGKVSFMAEKLKEKKNVAIREILNKRSQIIEEMVTDSQEEIATNFSEEVSVNPEELINF